MITSFSRMPKKSRLWIFQSNRKFLKNELSEINTSIKIFLEKWISHGRDLTCSFQIKYDRFIILALDESSVAASGCSIDSCIQFIQSIEIKYKVDLLDKMNITFKQGEFFTYKTISEFKDLIKNKSVTKNTIVFNNLVTDIKDFSKNWEVPAKKSWHNRYF